MTYDARTPVPGAGAIIAAAAFGRLGWLGEERIAYDALASSANRLLALLAEREVDHVVVGGLAMAQYVEARNTLDIDLVIAVSELTKLPELEITDRNSDFVRASFEGVTVDLLLTSNVLFAEVARNHTTVRPFGGVDVPCATPQGLFILKLFALPSLYRQGDMGRAALYESDLRMLLQAQPIDVAAAFALLEPLLLPSDVRELHAIVTGIEATVSRAAAHGFGAAPGP